MWRASRTERAQRGFTLLEILVALAIFAIACVIAYSGLNAVASTKHRLDQEIRFWRELGQVFDRIEIDVTQTVPRVFQAADGTLYPPLRGATDAAGFFIELSRFDGERTPVRAVYRCSDGALRLSLEPIGRRATSAATVAPEATVAAPVLLQTIESCEAAYLDATNTWRSAWPLDQNQLKPRALRIVLTLAERGKFERIYALP